MPLPILESSTAPTPENLVRLFHRTELHWTRHIAEEETLDAGTAFTNPELDGVNDANRMLDAALPPGVSPAGAVAEVEAHFASRGVRCSMWSMNPSAKPEATAPLVEYLLSRGYRAVVDEIMHLPSQSVGAAAVAPRELPGLTIIPARASYRHMRELAEARGRHWNSTQLADSIMLHLDDPHYDALLALHGGAAVACTGVLAVGDFGAIEEVFVLDSHRGRGIGRVMMARALEICARSLFKHVLLYVDPSNEPATKLYRGCGFKTIGTYTTYHAP
jgi:ribosomal protein S18 acetylase RimI-like enzyme